MKSDPPAVEPAEDRLRVLVIDDERDHAETVAEILEDSGYASAVATSGREEPAASSPRSSTSF